MTEASGQPIESSRHFENATEVATTCAQFVEDQAAFSQTASNDLRRLLERGLAIQSPAQQRLEMLGLLMELVSEGGEFIPTTRYEAARKERAAQGKTWPTASTVLRNYGHWLSAVRAANRFWFNGGRERVAADHTHATGTRAGYQPQDIVAALREAKRDLKLPAEEWPTQWEYEEWARIKRRLARRAGTAGACLAGGGGALSRGPCGKRLPGLKQVRKAFGGYDQAVQVARATR